MKALTTVKNNLLGTLFIAFAICFATSLTAQGGIWTWMHGSEFSNDMGDYGVKGVTAETNLPPPRYQAAHWTDKDGNFWMYGGTNTNFQDYQDLWKFDPQINQWTWIHGPSSVNQPVVYGIKGVPSPQNLPPGSGFGGLRWYDGDDGFYIYGGVAGFGFNTNVWKYNISTNEWAWLFGPGSIESVPNYGVKGVASPNNTPGFRAENEACWFKNDTLWFFGGQCRDGQEPVFVSCSDIWAFDLSANEWIWIHGPIAYDIFGVPGILGEHDPANFPGGRFAYTDWVTDSNYYCYSGMNNQGGITRTDLWEYNMKDQTWAWKDGSQSMTNPTWDEYCGSDVQDNPSSAVEHSSAHSKIDCNDIFWLFGGVRGFGNSTFKNDLWAYVLQKETWTLVWGNPENPVPSNYGEKGVPNIGNAIPARSGANMWVDQNNDLWVWGGFREGFQDVTNDMWHLKSAISCLGLDSLICCELTVDIRLGHVSSDSIDNGTISINVLDGEGELEFSIDGGITWTDDNFFQDLPAGDYTIIVRDETGCIYEGIVTILDFNTSTFGLKNDLKIEAFPNPATDILYYAIGSRDADRVQIYSMSGEEQVCRKADRRIEVKDLQAGMYLLRIVSEGKSGVVKFEKI